MPTTTAATTESTNTPARLIRLSAEHSRPITLEWITDRQGDKEASCPDLTDQQEEELAKVVPLMGSGFYFIALLDGKVRMLMEYEIGEGGDFEYPPAVFSAMVRRQEQVIFSILPKIRADLPEAGIEVSAPARGLCFGNRPTIWISMDPGVATEELAERLWQTTGKHFHDAYNAMFPEHPLK